MTEEYASLVSEVFEMPDDHRSGDTVDFVDVAADADAEENADEPTWKRISRRISFSDATRQSVSLLSQIMSHNNWHLSAFKYFMCMVNIMPMLGIMYYLQVARGLQLYAFGIVYAVVISNPVVRNVVQYHI